VEFARRRSPRGVSLVAWLAAAAIGARVVIAGMAEAPVVVAWWHGPQVLASSKRLCRSEVRKSSFVAS
jgi:hypothetical protein